VKGKDLHLNLHRCSCGFVAYTRAEWLDHRLGVDAAEQAAGDSGIVAAMHKEVELTKFEVEMHAFQKGIIRYVYVPSKDLNGDAERDLEHVFYWGQNDFQPMRRRCSVSMGDIARYNGQRWLCAMVGWELIQEGAQQ
jgi:hypothetical protein